jgi:hypothetical protein
MELNDATRLWVRKRHFEVEGSLPAIVNFAPAKDGDVELLNPVDVAADTIREVYVDHKNISYVLSTFIGI